MTEVSVVMPTKVFFLLFALCFCPLSYSQSDQSDAEHKSHHPDIYGDQAPTEANADGPLLIKPGKGNGPPAGMGKGMGAMMDKMMEKMGAPKPLDLYPSLMRLDTMDQEQKTLVSRQASDRMMQGTNMMLSGFRALQEAADVGNYDNMQQAIWIVDEGLARYDSGLAAQRVIEEGQAPQRVALKWFKGQMNLLPSLQEKPSTTFWGMSGLHSGVMFILLFFSVSMIWMYFYKMRRAARLLSDLTQASPNETLLADTINKTVEPVSSGGESPVSTDTPPTITPNVKPGVSYTGTLTVIGTFEETHDVKTFRLACDTPGELPFTFEPGQFITFTIDLPGQAKPVKRSYTIASSPTERHYLEVTIKREEQGLVSRYMHDEVKVNTPLNVKVPGGKFFFNGKDKDSVVLISGGVGITPMMSAVRYLTTRCWTGNIYFLFCARSTRDFIFEQELRYLQQRYHNLHVLVSMTRAEGTSWMGPQGRFNSRQIQEFVPDIVDKDCHICGPGPMMSAIKDMLTELGVPLEHIKMEAFGPVKKPVSSSEQQKTLTTEQAQSSGNQVNFTVSRKSVICPPGQTILETAEALDIDIENSCRAGTCGSCKIRLLDGRVTMEEDAALDEQDKAQGCILACQAIPQTAVRVEV